MNLKSILPYIVAAMIAGASFLSGAVTQPGELFKLAFDKDGLTVACEKLVRGDEKAAEAVTEAAAE